MLINIVSKIINKIYIKKILLIGPRILLNVNKANNNKIKRALLIYLMEPFIYKPGNYIYNTHQNIKQCRQIAEILDEYGYIVDVSDIRNKKFKVKHDYDLIITHKMNFKGYEDLLPSIGLKIYLATGMNHKIHNINLHRRQTNLMKRRKCALTKLTWDDENIEALSKYDSIVCFGNNVTASTWAKDFDNTIYSFNNYGFDSIKFVKKDYSVAKNNFLFFGSRQQLGKGLDLLLEIFPKHPELNLYVCSYFKDEEDFCKCYEEELFRTSNIHPVGVITVGGEEFYNLMRICAFVILPSASEGQPGSVIQCMHAGLIPMVTKECGFSDEEINITFADDTMEEIENTILMHTKKDNNWFTAQSERVRNLSLQKYSEERFIARWQSILQNIHENSEHIINRNI